jgi:hypothetical protein
MSSLDGEIFDTDLSSDNEPQRLKSLFTQGFPAELSPVAAEMFAKLHDCALRTLHQEDHRQARVA